MGQGEPLTNYNETKQFIKILKKKGIHMGKKSITLSGILSAR